MVKEGPPGAIAFEGHEVVGLLQAAFWEDAGDAVLMGRLACWRRCSPALARAWLVEEVLTARARALFWVKTGEGQIVGHVGLSPFDFAGGTVVLAAEGVRAPWSGCSERRRGPWGSGRRVVRAACRQ